MSNQSQIMQTSKKRIVVADMTTERKEKVNLNRKRSRDKQTLEFSETKVR
jgi:hypothetical protein